MLRNYIKLAFRNVIRDKSFSLLNLAGLSVGLASVIMIMAYVRYELSYDKSYSNYKQVYRLVEENKEGNADDYLLSLPMGLAKVLQKEFPAVHDFSVVSLGKLDFKHKDEIISLTDINGTAGFFKLFNFDFINGEPNTALNEPGSVVITQKVARQFFGDKNPVGAYLAKATGKPLRVTGVIKEIPANSHLSADMVISLSGNKSTEEALNWQAYTGLPQYVSIVKGTDPKKLEAGFAAIYKKYKFPAGVAIHLQPVTDIHLRSHYEEEISINSDIKYIYIFSSAALLILFIACINYVNLTTARSLQRAKEIGLRKVLGALRKQLVTQFLTESFLFFFISIIVALIIAMIAWPAFSAKITSYGADIPLFDSASIAVIFLIFAVGGLFAGAYPAFFLSSLQPVRVLKGLSKFGINMSVRKALVVLQFVISGVLIVSAIVVQQQLNFISNAPLGFNKYNLVTVPFYIMKTDVSPFKNELLKNPGIQSIGVAGWEVGMRYGASSSMPDEKDSTKILKFQFIDGDLDFIKTLGINIVTGRSFSTAHSNDTLDLWSPGNRKLSGAEWTKATASKSVILNEEAAKILNIRDANDTTISKGAVQGTVIGIVKNFNGLTLHQKIPAVVLRCSANVSFGQMYIRISAHNTQKTLGYIEREWRQFYPGHRFELTFVDDKLQELYAADRRLGTIFFTFATLAIAIGCVGLFGLISLTVQNRVKEIGIRKVLGASVLDITGLVSVGFLKLIIVSLVISSPIAWYAMNRWLQDFAYRINIQWWVFAVAAFLSTIIALATLSFQSIKAAMANPVKSLRSE